MAKSTARERRAVAREQRRGSTTRETETDGTNDAVEGDPADALRAAASAAIAGAAVGAARALARRRHADEDDDVEEAPEEKLEPAASDEGSEDDEEADSEQEQAREPVSGGDARRIVDGAREQLSALHGAEAESVSAVRRTADGWRVGLEVVEVHRIPESTDVLATYEVEVDGDGRLLTFERTGRYYRSEADRR
jgi:hypothetical protein